MVRLKGVCNTVVCIALCVGLLVGWSLTTLQGEFQEIAPLYKDKDKTTAEENYPNLRAEARFPVSNVVLMGQFGFDLPVERILEWVKIWSKYFEHLEVVGPFSQATQQSLRLAGVPFFVSADDTGIYSSYLNHANLMRFVQERKERDISSTTIDAVMTVHDDAIINFTAITESRGGEYPVDSIESTLNSEYMAGGLSFFLTVAVSEDKETSQIDKEIYMEAFHEQGYRITDIDELKNNKLQKWDNWDRCLNPFMKMLEENYLELIKYAETYVETATDSGTIKKSYYRFHLRGVAQADFLSMPVKYAFLYGQLGEMHNRHQVFLECAVPSMVSWITMEYYKSPLYQVHKEELQKNANLIEIPHEFAAPAHLTSEDLPSHHRNRLCTRWDSGRKTKDGITSMVSSCIEEGGYGMIHPVKISQFGADGLEAWMNEINGQSFASSV